MNTDLRPSGIEGLGDMSWGTHFCMFYDTKEDLLNVLLQYFKAGLENNESCLWVTPEPLSPEETKRAMRQAGLEFERHLAEGQIEIVSYKDLYLAGGHFDTQQVLQGWIDKHDQAIAKGYTGLRCTGNTFWLEKHQWDSFAKYEAEIDRVLSKLQIIVLCTYSLERCSAVDVLDVVHHHQFTVAKRNGVWEHLGGSELKRAHDEIQQLNAKLEQRVMERTAELTAMNEQLRREIADRERTEALVQAKEEEFRAIVENTPDQIIRYDRNLNRIYVNPAVTKAYALSKEAFIGKPVGSIVTDARLVVNTEEVEAQRRRIQAVFDTGEPNETEVTWPLPAGRRTFSSRLFPEFDPNGEVISVLGIARDITEHKRAEEAIRKSEQVLREAESLGHTGSWEQNLVTGEIFNTEENLRLFFGDDRGKGANFEDYTQTVHPDDHEYLLRRRAELLEEEGPSDIEYRVIWPDGSIHVIFGRATVVRNELGQAIRVYGTNVDITERKRAEEELKTQKEILQKIFDHTPMMIGIIGTDGKWLMVNQALESTMGWTLEEIQRPNFDILAEVYPDPQEHQRVMDFIAAKSGKWEEFKARARHGSALDITFTNVYLSDGTTLGFGLDTTERKQVEEEIRRHAARMEALAEISQALAEVSL